ncbi:MAG TPA: hypothetical protein VJB16_06165 [archaeon]|nr:hypothetical protein [archaeon]
MPEFERRWPHVERTIAGIAAADGRVRVTGRVIDKGESSVVVDDGTGSVAVTVPEVPGWVEVGGVVRVLAKVMPADQGVELDGEVLQDMRGLDLELWKKVREKEAEKV